MSNEKIIIPIEDRLGYRYMTNGDYDNIHSIFASLADNEVIDISNAIMTPYIQSSLIGLTSKLCAPTNSEMQRVLDYNRESSETLKAYNNRIVNLKLLDGDLKEYLMGLSEDMVYQIVSKDVYSIAAIVLACRPSIKLSFDSHLADFGQFCVHSLYTYFQIQSGEEVLDYSTNFLDLYRVKEHQGNTIFLDNGEEVDTDIVGHRILLPATFGSEPLAKQPRWGRFIVEMSKHAKAIGKPKPSLKEFIDEEILK